MHRVEEHNRTQLESTTELHTEREQEPKMFKQLLLLGCLALVAGNPFERPVGINPFTPSGQIIGGDFVAIEEVPHQVSLQISGFGFCGGSIISDSWILTAAHCMNYPADYITVRAGTATKSVGGSLHRVAEIVKHEDFYTTMRGVPVNDVAVMKLAEPLKLDATRQPIPMFNQDEESLSGVKATITGWGAAVEGGSGTDRLKAVDIPIVAKDVCNDAYQPFGGVPAGQICAAYPKGGADACQGDSGGPLAINGRLAGIVSWGYGCARRGYPGVHTEVAAFRDWIKTKTGV